MVYLQSRRLGATYMEWIIVNGTSDRGFLIFP